ncbi:MAG: amidohydrolase, partial [Gemmatimonadota bacterium]
RAPRRRRPRHPPPTPPAESPQPFPSTYTAQVSRPTLIRNATVLTATGPAIANGSVLLRDGKVAEIGTNITAPGDATVIDAGGKWVTPGVIDTHSHMGVYSSPGIASLSDGNEMTDPVTAQVWAEHSIWPQDPQFALALAGGITTAQILPGSGNLIGGRGVTIKNVPTRTMQGMKFPGAPYGLKMACGENPKRVYGERTRAPSTAMGNMAGYRMAWIRAAKYRDDMAAWKKAGSDPTKRPTRDLQLETLAGVLDGEILVQNHCYRADEMANMIDLAKEFGYKIASFHHAVESYKIRDLLAREGICSSMWADWWGFKLEAYDGIQANIPLVHEAGACAIVHSDDAQGIQRLNQEAAKAMTAGKQAGINLTREDVIKWITLNPAKALGIDKWTGSLEPGKMGDVVIWSGDPFSVYSKAEKVFIDGALIYDRNDPRFQPKSDFILGITPKVVTK